MTPPILYGVSARWKEKLIIWDPTPKTNMELLRLHSSDPLTYGEELEIKIN